MAITPCSCMRKDMWNRSEWNLKSKARDWQKKRRDKTRSCNSKRFVMTVRSTARSQATWSISPEELAFLAACSAKRSHKKHFQIQWWQHSSVWLFPGGSCLRQWMDSHSSCRRTSDYRWSVSRSCPDKASVDCSEASWNAANDIMNWSPVHLSGVSMLLLQEQDELSSGKLLRQTHRVCVRSPWALMPSYTRVTTCTLRPWTCCNRSPPRLHTFRVGGSDTRCERCRHCPCCSFCSDKHRAQYAFLRRRRLKWNGEALDQRRYLWGAPALPKKSEIKLPVKLLYHGKPIQLSDLTWRRDDKMPHITDNR